MRKSNREVNGEKVFRYSIRKYHFGAASVAVAALMFFANGAVKADTLPVSSATANTEKVNDGVTELTEGVSTGLKDNVESKVQTTELQEKVSALQSEVNRIRANEKQKAQIEQAEKLIKEVNDLQASKTATQKEVEAKVKEIKSLTFILKSMKAEETVKPKKNQDSRNGKKMVKGTGFRMGEGTPESTPSTPQPEGNVIARGEDGVPWELYENGYLLFKPEVGKDTLTNNSGESTWKVNYGAQIKHVGFADKVYAPENSERLFAKFGLSDGTYKDRDFVPLTFDTMHFDTSKVTNMRGMFSDLYNLTNLDVTHFDTSKVTDMSEMFKGMSNLTNLDLTHFDTSEVTNMEDEDIEENYMLEMFDGAGKLKELKLGDKFKADGIRTIPTTHSYGNQYTDKWHKVGDKEHTYTVSDWADAYAGNSTATAGTWVREVSNATLTFQGENFTPVKVTPSDTALPTLPRPSQPKQNHKFLGWSKDGTNLLTRDAVTPGETITLQPLWQPVNNTTTRTEGIPIATIYRADGTIPFESRQEVAGQEGEKTITTTYTVAPYTGELTNPVESERVTTEMQPKVIKVGTKPTITYFKEGNKVVKSTTTYNVNPDTGAVTEAGTTKETISEDGAKDKVVYSKEGNKVVKSTTTYNVNPDTGAVTEAGTTKETISEDGAKDNAVTPAAKTKAANVSKRNSQKELPNTGTSISGTVLPAIAALLLGVGVFATKKKEDE